MSLDTEYDRDNIFAKIIRGEMACVKLHETDDILAFMDVFPQRNRTVSLSLQNVIITEKLARYS